MSKAIEDMASKYECTVEHINSYQLRFFHFGRKIFDYYPKKRRLNDYNKWHSLYGDKQLETILDTFVLTDEIYVDHKKVDFKTKVERLTTNKTK